jgi:hypothetical protein
MIRRIESAGERLLGVFVPKVKASAVCEPHVWCEWCGPRSFRPIFVDRDCIGVPGMCGDPRCRFAG